LPAKPSVDFVYFDAGGGHRSAALALQAVIQREQYDWNVRLMNLQEVLDPLDIFRKVSGIRLQDLYNLMLAKGWTRGSKTLLKLMHGVIRIYHAQQVKLLTRYWQEQQPDLVVSLVPNFNRALFQSLHRALPGRPMATVLTDMADYPPHFWMERQPEQYFVCGTRRAVEQADAIGHPAARTFLVSGMILRPTFYEVPGVDRRAERLRLGLDAELPTGLVLFGGEGAGAMYDIARRLGNSKLELQLIFICGRNKRLKERLLTLETRNRMHVEGFTKQVPQYMQLADFFIGKPGPGSISEALHMGLPVIIERNACTLPQERYNADWVREEGVGIVLPNFRGIEGALARLLLGDSMAVMRKRIGGRIQNRAVFEVPQMLAGILATHLAGYAGTNRG
jgi:UDP-N-acetylglucosamine:LPS N-acetylglucosamine transferase